MAAVALVDVLQDFGTSSPKLTGPVSLPDLEIAEIAAFAAEPDSPPIEELIRREVEEAEALLREQLAAEHLAALEQERAMHAAELAELHARFGEEVGETVANRLAEMEDRLTELATSATARILAVHTSADIQQRMTAALAQTIRSALRDKETVRVRVTGPLSLYEKLTQALGEYSAHLDYSETASFDLSVAIDETLLETRLSEWAAALAEALS